MTYTSFTQGSKSLTPTSRVFVTSLGRHDISEIYEFVGSDVDIHDGYVNVHPYAMNGYNIVEDERRIEEKLKDFRVGEDYFMVAGRGFTNFIIASVITRLFSGQTIDLLMFDAKNLKYYHVQWAVPGARGE